ncbi:MAG: hypothetical protein GWN29_12875, partial [Gammaproteobacteria bacterium]|nr:hypothetical protein [Gammaproteobacteria bacterium]
QALGLSPRSLPHLFALSWARYLATLISRLHETDLDTAYRPDATIEWLGSNRYYALWKYTLEHWDELDL